MKYDANTNAEKLGEKMTDENSASTWDRNYLTMAVHQDSEENNHAVAMDDDDDDRNEFDGFSSSV